MSTNTPSTLLFPQHILKQPLSPISISQSLSPSIFPPLGAQELSICQEQATKGTQLGYSPGKYGPLVRGIKVLGPFSACDSSVFSFLPYRVVH